MLITSELTALQRMKGTHYDAAVIDSLSKLGALSQNLNDLKGARRYYERALEAKESLYGYYHEKTLLTVSRLALVLKNLVS